MAVGVGNKKSWVNVLALVRLTKIGVFQERAYTYGNINGDNISGCISLAHMAIISFFAEFDQQW